MTTNLHTAAMRALRLKYDELLERADRLRELIDLLEINYDCTEADFERRAQATGAAEYEDYRQPGTTMLLDAVRRWLDANTYPEE